MLLPEPESHRQCGFRLPARANQHKESVKWDPKWMPEAGRTGSVPIMSKDLNASKTDALGAGGTILLTVVLINVREGGV
jgi:hypothetical protein